MTGPLRLTTRTATEVRVFDPLVLRRGLSHWPREPFVRGCCSGIPQLSQIAFLLCGGDAFCKPGKFLALLLYSGIALTRSGTVAQCGFEPTGGDALALWGRSACKAEKTLRILYGGCHRTRLLCALTVVLFGFIYGAGCFSGTVLHNIWLGLLATAHSQDVMGYAGEFLCGIEQAALQGTRHEVHQGAPAAA